MADMLEHLKQSNVASWHCKSGLARGPGRAGHPVWVQEQRGAEQQNSGIPLSGHWQGARHSPIVFSPYFLQFDEEMFTPQGLQWYTSRG